MVLLKKLLSQGHSGPNSWCFQKWLKWPFETTKLAFFRFDLRAGTNWNYTNLWYKDLELGFVIIPRSSQRQTPFRRYMIFISEEWESTIATTLGGYPKSFPRIRSLMKGYWSCCLSFNISLNFFNCGVVVRRRGGGVGKSFRHLKYRSTGPSGVVLGIGDFLIYICLTQSLYRWVPPF